MGVYGDGKEKKKSARKSSGTDTSYGAQFRGYINLPVTAEDKAAFEHWAQSESVWEQLSFAVSDGIVMSLKIDPKGSGFMASATQRRSTSPNAGLVVTARAGEPLPALLRLLFCLTLLGHAERWEDVQPVADPDRW